VRGIVVLNTDSPHLDQRNLRIHSVVMPGLEPGIHVFGDACKKDVDGRDKPGHDEP